jgi:hypothetical protein
MNHRLNVCIPTGWENPTWLIWSFPTSVVIKDNRFDITLTLESQSHLTDLVISYVGMG